MPSDRPDRELEPLLGDLLTKAMRRLVRRGRKEVERVADRSRHRLELRQRQKDLDHFWMRLGKTAWRLVEAGEIDHPSLRKAMERIEELERSIDDLKSTTATEPLAEDPSPR
jgi:hypothetical protein